MSSCWCGCYTATTRTLLNRLKQVLFVGRRFRSESWNRLSPHPDGTLYSPPCWLLVPTAALLLLLLLLLLLTSTRNGLPKIGSPRKHTCICICICIGIGIGICTGICTGTGEPLLLQLLHRCVLHQQWRHAAVQ